MTTRTAGNILVDLDVDPADASFSYSVAADQVAALYQAVDDAKAQLDEYLEWVNTPGMVYCDHPDQHGHVCDLCGRFDDNPENFQHDDDYRVWTADLDDLERARFVGEIEPLWIRAGIILDPRTGIAHPVRVGI